MMAGGGMGMWLRLAATMVVSGAMAGAASADQVIADDVIIQGSTCVGFDCVNNENFGVDTIRLKRTTSASISTTPVPRPGFRRTTGPSRSTISPRADAAISRSSTGRRARP